MALARFKFAINAKWLITPQACPPPLTAAQPSGSVRAMSDQKQSPIPDFEKSLTELETLVERMESGELSLEDSLKHFERGVTLSRQCQQALREARARVESLMSNDTESARDDGSAAGG